MNYFRVFASKDKPGDWIVQAFDEDGETLTSIFTGSDARERAEEYSAWKNQILPHLQAA